MTPGKYTLPLIGWAIADFYEKQPIALHRCPDCGDTLASIEAQMGACRLANEGATIVTLTRVCEDCERERARKIRRDVVTLGLP